MLFLSNVKTVAKMSEQNQTTGDLIVQKNGSNRLKTSVQQEKGLHLNVFFSFKTQETSMSFRAIVLNRGHDDRFRV